VYLYLLLKLVRSLSAEFRQAREMAQAQRRKERFEEHMRAKQAQQLAEFKNSNRRVPPSERSLASTPDNQKESQASPTEFPEQRQARQSSLQPKTFIVLDLETTGLDPSTCEIIEIAAIKVALDKQTHPTFQRLVRPTRKIPAFITNLTGITQAMVDAEGVYLHKAMRELLAFIGDAPIVAYNAEFDMGFLRKAANDCGLSLPNQSTCALKMARKAFPGKKSYKLEHLATEFSLPNSDHHRALSDCERTLHIFWVSTVLLQAS
jgi:DNA polymerase III subunit epsilon